VTLIWIVEFPVRPFTMPEGDSERDDILERSSWPPSQMLSSWAKRVPGVPMISRTLAFGGAVALALQLGLAHIAIAQSSGKTAQKQGPGMFQKEVGSLYSRYDRSTWQSPEAVLADLRSREDDKRLNAFRLLGAADKDAYAFIHGKNEDWEEVATPWQSELRYSALGDDGIQDAVVAVQVRNLVMIAVAVPKDEHWERVAAFKSICPSNNTLDSYGSANGSNLIGATVDVGRFQDKGSERYELILSVIDFLIEGERVLSFNEYVQHEAHFRLYVGKLLRTISFERRTHSCRNAQKECSIQRRWFYHQGFGFTHSVAGAILVEAEGVTRAGAFEPYQTDLEEQDLRFRSCSTLRFNNQAHRFEPFSPAEAPSLNVCAGLVGVPH
jgi:hypothetical protein